jgi:hypothetical protein
VAAAYCFPGLCVLAFPYSPYVIERFNSFGDSFFHSVANFLQSIYTYFSPSQTA